MAHLCINVRERATSVNRERELGRSLAHRGVAMTHRDVKLQNAVIAHGHVRFGWHTHACLNPLASKRIPKVPKPVAWCYLSTDHGLDTSVWQPQRACRPHCHFTEVTVQGAGAPIAPPTARWQRGCFCPNHCTTREQSQTMDAYAAMASCCWEVTLACQVSAVHRCLHMHTVSERLRLLCAGLVQSKLNFLQRVSAQSVVDLVLRSSPPAGIMPYCAASHTLDVECFEPTPQQLGIVYLGSSEQVPIVNKL